MSARPREAGAEWDNVFKPPPAPEIDCRRWRELITYRASSDTRSNDITGVLTASYSMILKLYFKACQAPSASRPPSVVRLFPGLLVLLVLALQLLPSALLGQEDVEDILGEDTQASEATFVVERLERLRGKPIDLNTATADELTQLPWITPLLARKIIALRDRAGRFRSLVNLSVIEGVTYELLTDISPYVTIAYKDAPYWIPTEGRLRASGETPVRTARNLHLYGRVTSRPSEEVEMSYLVDRDPGESTVTDFQAAYVTYTRDGVLSRVNAGDLSAEFGQGLVLWAPGGFFRGYETVSQAARGAAGVRGYRSSVENGALRGVHVGLAQSWLSLDALLSRSELDAYLNDDGTVRRLSDTGYHREDWELEGKDALTEDLFAVHAAVKQSDALRFEATFASSSYEPEFSSGDTGSQSSGALYYAGDGVSVGGLGVNLSLPQVDLFGEAAMMTGGSKAFLLGWVCDLRRVEMATVFRSYDRDYYNLRASSFSGGDPWNERGIYLGLQTRLADSKFNFYLDGVQHPGRSYGESFPKSGYEAVASVERKYANGVTTKLRGKLTKREDSVADPVDPYARKSVTSSRQTYYGDIIWDAGRPLSFRLRYGSVKADGGEKGSLVFAGFTYRTQGVVSLRGRVIYYDTSSYESRVYEYEDDLPGRVSLDPLWGEGMRWYVLLGVRGKKLGASAKFAQNQPADADGEESASSELGLQLDFAF